MQTILVSPLRTVDQGTVCLPHIVHRQFHIITLACNAQQLAAPCSRIQQRAVNPTRLVSTDGQYVLRGTLLGDNGIDCHRNLLAGSIGEIDIVRHILGIFDVVHQETATRSHVIASVFRNSGETVYQLVYGHLIQQRQVLVAIA